MTRRYIALGGIFAAIAVSFAGLHRFEGHRLAQSAIMLGYVVAVLLLMRWSKRASAR